jgi:hypothetical protein
VKRQSLDATYDSCDTGERFHVTTQVGDRTIAFQRRLPDPFVRATVTVGLRDTLRALVRRKPIEVTVIVGGDPEVMNDVLELDYNTLIPGSTRRDDWDAHVRDVVTAALQDDPEQA